VIPDDTGHINPVYQMLITPIVIQAIFEGLSNFHEVFFTEYTDTEW
jgi:hypothetical protein